MLADSTKPVVDNGLTVEEPKLEALTEVKPGDQVNFVQRLRENTDKFLDMVGKFEGSRRQLQAVLAGIMVHPFNDKPFQWGYSAQKELFDLANMITSDKLCLFHLGILEEEYAKQVKQRTTPVTPETQETQNG